jgi:hypothetical protein
MKGYREVVLQLHPILTSVINGSGEPHVSADLPPPTPHPPGEDTQILIGEEDEWGPGMVLTFWRREYYMYFWFSRRGVFFKKAF